MKKFVTVVLSFIFVLSMTQASFAQRPIKVVVGGEKLESDVAPTIVDGRTLLPVRAVFESIGASVDYVADQQKVVAKKGDREVSFVIGTNTMTINGEEKEIDVAARIVDGRTLVPLRACAEAFDLDVAWDDASKTAKVKAETVVVSSSKDISGEKTYTYDADGNLTSVEGDNNYYEKYEYDEKGNLIYSENSYGYTEKIAYNEYGEVISIEDQNGRIKTYTYDDNGNLIDEQTSDGVWTKYAYDANNLLITKENSDGVLTKYTYNDKKQLIADESFMAAAQFSAKNTYEYDEKGNLTLHYSHSDDWTFIYDYDDAGNLVHTKTTYAESTMTEFVCMYDENGNLVREKGVDIPFYATYEYDEDGYLKYYSNSDDEWEEYIRIVK